MSALLTKGKIQMKIKSLCAVLVIILIVCFSSVTAFAAPEDGNSSYNTPDIVSSQAEDSQSSYAEPPTAAPYEEPTQPEYSQPDPTDPLPTQPQPTEPEYTQPQETQPEYSQPEETNPPYENPTYEQYTDSATEAYTDKPTQPRTSSTDTDGNLAAGIGLWISILVGIIIVSGIMINTHIRKTK